MGKNHDDVATRWVARALGSKGEAYKSNNLLDWGDYIMSYGSHFEIARVLRGKRGEPRAWLLNGNTYSSTTNRHQAAVRSAIARKSTLPRITIPYAVLEAAGIVLNTIEIVDVQRDWNTTTVIEREDVPGHWEYETEHEPGGWQNTKTGEFVQRTAYWGEGSKAPAIEYSEPRPTYHWGPDEGSYSDHLDRVAAWEERMRIRHGVWEEIPGGTRRTGRKRMVSGKNGNIEWELVDAPESPLGYVFLREVHRHWLGSSLIRAAVNQPIRKRCARCDATGQVEPWYIVRDVGEGPMTREQAEVWQLRSDRRMERNGGIREPMQWFVDVAIQHTECRACSGSGFVRATRRRWAYYLSGFDSNETRPSYFFCELPRGAKPTTVEEALESLKPESVRLAEQMGREVKRQGDIYTVPMPSITTRDLRKRGAVIEKNAYILDTNHQATEVARIGGETYVRGTLKHAPQFRRPDHRRITIGKQWSLAMTNAVPR